MDGLANLSEWRPHPVMCGGQLESPPRIDRPQNSCSMFHAPVSINQLILDSQKALTRAIGDSAARDHGD